MYKNLRDQLIKDGTQTSSEGSLEELEKKI